MKGGALFPLGRLVATPAAKEALDGAYPTGEAEKAAAGFVARHLRGDWGEMDEHDYAVNNRALLQGSQLLSAYHLADGTKIYIITEADRSVTTILLPDDY